MTKHPYQTALITGASGGIGEALAYEHARRGGKLIIVARSGDKLHALKHKLEQTYDVEVYCIAMDLARGGAAQELYDQIAALPVEVDMLINNAGFGDSGFFHEADWAKTEGMIDLNMKTLTHLTRLYLPDMIARNSGYIMNVASTASFQPGPLMAVYYATKHYVLAFSEAIANEAGPFGVKVSALCPGPTASGFQQTAAIENVKLVKNNRLPSSAEVAAYGYKAMLRGRTVAIHGSLNRLMARSVNFLPRKLVTRMVRKLQESA